jgi:hypothetical protein
MSAPTEAEWAYAIRVLERERQARLAEAADGGGLPMSAAAALLDRVIEHMRTIAPPPFVWRCSCGARLRPIGALRVIGCPRCEGAAVP